ncbi:MAG TPA: BACON domain-containing carbohydrate-binding protein [Blastocatellia bacterium]|nr:BACON domain-containing carbohydrate-binding protein [Blastocatellia bacterium]
MQSRRLIGLVGVLTVLAGLSSAAYAQSDQVIYGDSLGAGWQDWSWCPRDLRSTDFVHGGSRSIKVTYTAAYQGFYLRHTAFDGALYTELTFWINGGGANGRNINVAAQLNDASQPGIALNAYVSVVAGAWRKVTIPLSALGVDNASNLNGFWLQDSSGSAQPPFYIDDIALTAAPPPSVVNITVAANDVKRTVDPRVFGVAGAIWDSQFATPSTISLMAANRTRITRFPGGSLSNNYHWNTNTSDNNTWQWATDFDEFASVTRAINAQAFISVNYGTGTAQEAADWVRYSNITKGYGFKFWEIGNENYGSWETDAHARPHDPFSYATLSRDYINAMKAVDPTVKVGVVVTTGENSYANYSDHPALNSRTGQTHNGWTPVLLSTLRSLGVTPDFVIYHKYEQQPGQEDDSTLLQAARTWVSDAVDLRRQLNDYLGVQAANIEIVATENNSVSSRPGKQTTSLVNGLYYADSIGQVLQTELNAFTWWIFRNGREANNNNSDLLYGWRQYGDYGMVSGDNDPYPAYYVSKLISNYLAAGGDQVVNASTDYSLLTAYAVKRASGELSLMVINKSRSSSLNASISLAGIVPQPSAAIYSYGIPQDEAARTGTGSPDIATTAFAGAAASFSYAFAPYSVTVIALTPAGGGCSVSVEAQFGKFKSRGGSGEFTVTSDAGCTWQASSNESWITITAGESGKGNGVVSIEVARNIEGRKRKGRVTVAGQVFVVTQKG